MTILNFNVISPLEIQGFDPRQEYTLGILQGKQELVLTMEDGTRVLILSPSPECTKRFIWSLGQSTSEVSFKTASFEDFRLWAKENDIDFIQRVNSNAQTVWNYCVR